MGAGLAEGGRGSAGLVWRRLGSKLVVLELATAMVLLVGAGLLGKSLKLLLVGGTRITPARVEQFRKTRPDCRVVWAPKYKEVKSEEDTRLIG